MQALEHILRGDPEKAREILARDEVDMAALGQIMEAGATLSDLAQQERGNRAQRRAAARARRHTARRT